MLGNKSTIAAQEKLAFLNCRRLPARLNTSETALILGFQEHDIAVLIAAHMLDPLGKPAANGPKYFAAVQVQILAENAEWLAKATRTIAKRWRDKNDRKNTRPMSAAA
jgi:hypothetical protein